MNPLEVAQVIDEFNVGPLNLTRRAAPTADALGEATPASPSTVVLDPVAIWPAQARELLQVPEADRHREVIGWATRQRVRVAGDGFASDVIAHAPPTGTARTYRVTSVNDLELQGEVFMGTAVLEDA